MSETDSLLPVTTTTRQRKSQQVIAARSSVGDTLVEGRRTVLRLRRRRLRVGSRHGRGHLLDRGVERRRRRTILVPVHREAVLYVSTCTYLQVLVHSIE